MPEQLWAFQTPLPALQDLYLPLWQDTSLMARYNERWYDPWPRDHGKYTAWGLHGPAQGRRPIGRGRGLVHAGRRRYIFVSPRPGVVSWHYNWARPTFNSFKVMDACSKKATHLNFPPKSNSGIITNWAVSWSWFSPRAESWPWYSPRAESWQYWNPWYRPVDDLRKWRLCSILEMILATFSLVKLV